MPAGIDVRIMPLILVTVIPRLHIPHIAILVRDIGMENNGSTETTNKKFKKKIDQKLKRKTYINIFT